MGELGRGDSKLERGDGHRPRSRSPRRERRSPDRDRHDRSRQQQQRERYEHRAGGDRERHSSRHDDRERHYRDHRESRGGAEELGKPSTSGRGGEEERARREPPPARDERSRHRSRSPGSGRRRSRSRSRERRNGARGSPTRPPPGDSRYRPGDWPEGGRGGGAGPGPGPGPDSRACFTCGEGGHSARDCPSKPAGGRGGGGGRGRGRRGGDADEGGSFAWGKEGEEAPVEQPAAPPPPPNMGLSGKLAAETNKIDGVVMKFQPPPEAKRCTQPRWRLYVFKGNQEVGDPLPLDKFPFFLFGKERKVADIPTDHPSCSRQHAIICFREVQKADAMGLLQGFQTVPYLMDLETANGTYLNGERIEASRFYELLEKDVIKFGYSSREYVLLHTGSSAEEGG